MNELPDRAASDAANTRIDQPHAPRQEEVAATPRRRKVRRDVGAEVVAAAATVSEPSLSTIAPVFVAEPPEAVPEIIIHHADDLSLHLAERLREVERRELAAAEYETKLQEAEAAARVWVMQRDMELTDRERMLQFRTDELSTSEAALAAVQIAAEDELHRQQAFLQERVAELERRDAEFSERQERLQGERAALDQALDKLRAERRRDEELQRGRQQKWQALLEADRAQAERTLANLQKHRDSLDQRERTLVAREALLSTPVPARLSSDNREVTKTERDPAAAIPIDTGARPDLELSVLRAEATRDHRLALEHRWIAGQLWTRLADSGLTSDEELQESLQQVRGQLELLYRREREALEVLRSALSATARQLKSAPRELKSRPTPRAMAFTG